MPITQLREKTINGTENKEFTVWVSISLKKAFDTTDHNILGKKLERYGTHPC